MFLDVRVFFPVVVEVEKGLSGHLRCRCWLHLGKTNKHQYSVFVCSCCANVEPRRLRLKTHTNKNNVRVVTSAMSVMNNSVRFLCGQDWEHGSHRPCSK